MRSVGDRGEGRRRMGGIKERRERKRVEERGEGWGTLCHLADTFIHKDFGESLRTGWGRGGGRRGRGGEGGLRLQDGFSECVASRC